MISSDTPGVYTSAVSIRFPPAATNASSWACAPASSVSWPNVIVPSVNVETTQPLLPKVRYSIATT